MVYLGEYYLCPYTCIFCYWVEFSLNVIWIQSVMIFLILLYSCWFFVYWHLIAKRVMLKSAKLWISWFLLRVCFIFASCILKLFYLVHIHLGLLCLLGEMSLLSFKLCSSYPWWFSWLLSLLCLIRTQPLKLSVHQYFMVYL